MQHGFSDFSHVFSHLHTSLFVTADTFASVIASSAVASMRDRRDLISMPRDKSPATMPMSTTSSTKFNIIRYSWLWTNNICDITPRYRIATY
jgi:hypothetical protein